MAAPTLQARTALRQAGGTTTPAVKGVTSTLGSGRQPGQQPSTDAKSPKKEPGGTDTKDENERPRTRRKTPRTRRKARASSPRFPIKWSASAAAPAPAAASVAAPAPTAAPAAAPAPTAVAPAPTAASVARRSPLRRRLPLRRCGAGSHCGAGPQCGGAVPDVVGAGFRRGRVGSGLLAPVAGAVAPVHATASLIQDKLTSVAGAVVPLTQLQSDLYSFLLGPDVIASVQDMLTSVAGAVVPLTQLQSELYSFLLGIAGMEPAAGLGGVDGAGLSPAGDAWVVSRWRLVLSLAAILGGPLAGTPPGLGRSGGLRHPFSARRPRQVERRARDGTASAQWRHSDGCAVVFPACRQRTLLTGSRGRCRSARRRRAYDHCRSRGATHFIGGAGRCRSARRRRACDPYRSRGARRIPPGQGRFRIADSGHRALRPSGAVPLGVVRSGSLVVVRPRALRVVRPGALSAGCLLDKVA